jgi:hypothetical protein
MNDDESVNFIPCFKELHELDKTRQFIFISAFLIICFSLYGGVFNEHAATTFAAVRNVVGDEYGVVLYGRRRVIFCFYRLFWL